MENMKIDNEVTVGAQPSAEQLQEIAHCKTGKRAGAMVMMHVASERGMSGKEALQQAEQMGFECDQPELKQFVEQYVDSHSRGNV